jgi:hypothetical protein
MHLLFSRECVGGKGWVILLVGADPAVNFVLKPERSIKHEVGGIPASFDFSWNYDTRGLVLEVAK